MYVNTRYNKTVLDPLQESRPLCGCHGVAMIKSGTRPDGGIKYKCRIKNNILTKEKTIEQRKRDSECSMRRYYRLKKEGICTNCGQDVSVTGILCFICAGKHDERNMMRIY